MPSVVVGVLEIDYSVAYPAVSFDLSIVVPDQVPVVGGKRYGLGGTSISLENPSVRIPISEGPLSGFIDFTLNTSRAEFSVGGEVDLDVTVYSHSWPIGPKRVRYMNRLVLVEPPWSVNPIKIPGEALQAAVNSAPDNQIIPDSGASNLRNDSATQAMIRGLLTFAGAGHLVDNMIAAAQKIGAAIASQTVQRAAVGAAAGGTGQTSAATSDVLIAFGMGIAGGAVVGASASRGVYFTSGGDYGAYGSYSIDIGMIAELSAGNTLHVYWPDAGKSAKDNFNGCNVLVAVDVGIEVFSGGVAVYWPTNADSLTVTSNVPCGVGLNLGLGVGLPVNFYIGNSQTFLGIVPAPKLRPHML
jgi:hypothetical protein